MQTRKNKIHEIEMVTRDMKQARSVEMNQEGGQDLWETEARCLRSSLAFLFSGWSTPSRWVGMTSFLHKKGDSG